jgi:SAM-dependent methyltransferase
MAAGDKNDASQGTRASSCRIEDTAFDRTLYPDAICALSARFWTPIGVAARAARLFRWAGARSVLDVGAGAGKFVLAAAVAEPDLDFVGIEQRGGLVDVARKAGRRLKIPNAYFLTGDFATVPWGLFDGLYFFNPLSENLFAKGEAIDDGVELSRSRFVRDVLRVEEALRTVRLGTLVVTYHGSSTRIPASFELSHSERAGSDRLRLWTKRRKFDDGSFFVEIEDRIMLWRPGATA